MNLHFSTEADREYEDALHYYQAHNPEAAAKFETAVDAGVEWLLEQHQLYRERSHGYQRYNLRGFPYYLPYIVWNDTLYIMAIAHASREPEYWLERPLPM